MKVEKIRKAAVLLTSVLLAGALAFGSFTSCAQNDDDDGGKSAKYSLTFKEDTSALAVDVGESINLTVKSMKGTYVYDSDNGSSAVTVEKTDSGFKITGNAESNGASLTFYPTEAAADDTSYDKTISVKVYSKYALTISLDDTLKASAASLTFKYGYSDNDGIALTAYETLTAAVTDGKATVNLKKTLSGIDTKDGWAGWNNCVVTLLDSEGTELSTPTAYQSYLSYNSTDESYLDTVSVTATTSEKTFTITFDGFTAKSVTGLVYTNTENDFDTTGSNATAATVTIAADGKTGTFTVEKSKVQAGGYFQVNFASVVITDTSDNTVTLTSGNSNDWFNYNDDTALNVTLAFNSSTKILCSEKTVTIAAENDYSSILEASDLSGKSIESLIVTVGSEGDWASVAAKNSGISDWDNGTEYVKNCAGKSTTISNPVFIYNAVKNGLYLNGSAAAFTVTVTYTETDSTKALGDFTAAAGTAESEKVPLSWTASENATLYEVYYKKTDDTDYTSAGVTTSTSMEVTGLTASTSYTFKVTAMYGSATKDSEEVTATTTEISGTTLELTAVTGTTAGWSNVEVLPASALSSYNLSKLEITITLDTALSTGNFCMYYGTTWFANLDWLESGTKFTYSTSDSTMLNNIKSNGLYIQCADSGTSFTAKTTITYTE